MWSRVYFTEALAEFHHVNCMIVRIACCARAETFTEAVASAASMVATPFGANAYNHVVLIILFCIHRTCSQK